MGWRLGVALLLLVLVSGISGAYGAAGEPQKRVIVVFKDKPDAELIKRHGGRVLRTYSIIPAVSAVVPESAMGRLRTSRGVAYVEEDAEVRLLRSSRSRRPSPEPSEPVQPSEVVPWGVAYVRANQVWDTDGDLSLDAGAPTGRGVKVAVLDTGIDRDHPDLVANLKGGVNFVSRSPRLPADPTAWDDDNGHGTFVAGVIAAADNSAGVIGVAPEAWVYAVKVIDWRGRGYESWVIAGIEWAVANGMQVISMSLGSPQESQALHDAVHRAYESGVLVVAAAGNSGDGVAATDEVEYPARYPCVIAVGAVDSSGAVPEWSSSGPAVELSAPGVDVYSTWAGGGYYTASGTSAATPHVSGVAALVLSTDITQVAPSYDLNGNGAWDAPEVRAWMDARARDLGAPGRDYLYGYGVVDALSSTTP